MMNIKKRHGANLPHWTAEGATYFVTFRLADSLPAGVLRQYAEARDRLLASFRDRQNGVNLAADFTAADAQAFGELYTREIDSHLDRGIGACWMRDPLVANLVQQSLFHFDNERYHIFAWCVMPNHVHAVVRPMTGVALTDILHSWKSFTANVANRKLGRVGTFWQSESYDHLIRDEADLAHAVSYTLQNPSKAGLKNWSWWGANRVYSQR